MDRGPLEVMETRGHGTDGGDGDGRISIGPRLIVVGEGSSGV